MKKVLIVFSLLFLTTAVTTLAQEGKKKASPKMEAKGTVDGVSVDIHYSAPSVKGREIWGGLVPYDKVWRTGANEATTVEFSKDVMVEGKPLAAGKYGLFTIPGKEGWVVIFNKTWDQWGAYKYKASDDALRVNVKANTGLKESQEQMNISVTKDGINLRWANLALPVSVKASK